jgi:DMSO/TMAO reductase YedYZ molybdopterin-dependent catalytic subunit
MGSFFDRNRRELAAKGIDPARLPPGQYATERFPVLHVGEVPDYGDLSSWDLRVFGNVEQPYTLRWDELLALPQHEVTVDLHCVTKWSMFDSRWRGVRLRDLYERAAVRPDTTHVLFHADPEGYTTNLPLAPTLADDALLAVGYGDDPIPADHGYPARTLVPSLYLWKSAKWVRGIELLAADRPGFWEVNGYHVVGDPFREQRFWDD